MNSGSDFLFVYGTLMHGFDNPFASRIRALSSYQGKGFFQGMLYRISWYPGAVYDKTVEEKVHGEVFRLSEDEGLLPLLDEYEDVLEDESGSLYLRKLVPITLSNKRIVLCWTYLYNQATEGLEIIPGGNFRHG